MDKKHLVKATVLEGNVPALLGGTDVAAARLPVHFGDWVAPAEVAVDAKWHFGWHPDFGSFRDDHKGPFGGRQSADRDGIGQFAGAKQIVGPNSDGVESVGTETGNRMVLGWCRHIHLGPFWTVKGMKGWKMGLD